MAALSNYSAQGLLNWVTGKTAMPTLVTPVYLALFTVAGTDAGTGFTECTGGAYARASIIAASWNSASGSAPSTTSINTTVSFTQSTAAWGTALAWGLYDASTAGNLMVWDYLGNYAWNPFTGTLASPSVLTVPAHGYLAADSVIISSEFGGALPTGFTTGNSYTVAASPTTDTFTLTTNASASGSGSVRKVASQVIANNTIVSFVSGALTITAA